MTLCFPSEKSTRNPIPPMRLSMKPTDIRGAVCSAALFLTLSFAARSQSLVPAAINYQGRLTDSLGNPVANGYYEIEFRLWDDAVQAGAGNLVWGRSFPLHVVSDGLFNVLLSDDGGQITSPSAPTNSILSAFSGQDRFLGLTIVSSNGVSLSNSEIKPRQQIAAAPYAVQAQNANSVRPLGVTSDAIASGAVIAGKLGNNAVTSGNLASGSVTSGKLAGSSVTTGAITNGAVTSAKLNIDGDISLNGHILYLASGATQGLVRNTSFSGSTVDGPVLFGAAGGMLGTRNGGDKTALSWESDRSVALHGALTAKSGAVSMFGPIQERNYLTTYTAETDGFVILAGFNGHYQFRLMNSSGTTVLTALLDGATSGANYEMTTFPVAKGEKWVWEHDPDHPNESSAPTIWWRPIGVGN
jgi:hypothetical protein